MPVTRHKPRNWRCRLGLLFSGLWATSKASAQVSNAADGSLNLESRTSAAAVEALNNAKGNLLRGSFSAAVEVASPYCGHILKVCKYRLSFGLIVLGSLGEMDSSNSASRGELPI